MTGFSTDRLEPTSRGGAISGQTEQRDFPPKPRRPRPPLHSQDSLQPDDPSSEPATEIPPHQLDDLA
jgi:hypothetical protein